MDLYSIEKKEMNIYLFSFGREKIIILLSLG